MLVDLLVRSLDGDDLAMFGAASVVEAGRIFDERRPDLVIVDPSVPGGFEFVDQVRRGLKPARVVALVDSDETREKMAAAGVEKTVDKALGLDGLADAIRSALNSSLALGGHSDRVRILVADDDDSLRPMLIDYLSGLGYAAFGARDGREAVELVPEDPFLRLVLLDVSMPRMGGLEVLRQIMLRPEHPDVIMITAVADREIAKQTINTGAFDYVLKPFDLSSLESSIVACLSYAEYHKRPWWQRLARRSA